ncbi:ankyrin repeat domain-containing protein [Paenibacillus sp. NEAU-GSW1]|uniref:ankyrin repeat domain-containing protein n=1 Tax=Paenibacillus sp. NEAU-GSW1 TaxID=2682486 RepID=UPI0012E21225|nr:ankyrin repeat domain-containing protein [Paenibacillus sp. NEAU-GSW1]MUT65684.1 hypothetical protein [Paenibacillus sp. NEAU-GSW1]
MGKRRKTLPKNFSEWIEEGDISKLQAVFEQCEWNATGGYSKGTALSFYKIPDELVRWLVEQGADINAVDSYKRTPLHAQASSWIGNVRLLLELGSNMEAVDYQGETPLHAAAGSYKTKAVQVLVNNGANIHALNNSRQSPLALALARCRNMDIESLSQIADILLDAGTPVTQEMMESVKRIGETFEFHRENFNKDYLEATDAALSHLYERFEVAPVKNRQMHDGLSRIEVTAMDWQAQHKELWDLLVPSQGHAKTVQGEVIRITGRVSNEILGNGGGNWDSDYKRMLKALIIHLGSGKPLDSSLLIEAETLAESIKNGDGDDELARLCELAVCWVLSNPNPLQLEQPNYKR